MNDEQMTKFLDGVVGVVEANSFEQHALWRFNEEKMDGKKLPWADENIGLGETIGRVAKKPVHISLRAATIDGHKILFVDATSRIVDHQMIRDWLNKMMPVTAFEGNDPRKRLNLTDATNFHNVFPRS